MLMEPERMRLCPAAAQAVPRQQLWPRELWLKLLVPQELERCRLEHTLATLSLSFALRRLAAERTCHITTLH